MKQTQSKKWHLRVRKQDSAFVYALLESMEGITNYSTVNYQPHTSHRELELTGSPDLEAEIEEFLDSIAALLIERQRLSSTSP